MFDKNTGHFLFALSLIIIASYVGNNFKNQFAESSDEYDMIKEYLLNDSPLYGSNKPKIWIHSKYDINARKWLSFQSRNTKNLNQPYLHLTIESVINHCSNDFHVCLIDDETFSKLIPGWDIDITNLAEPSKSIVREIAMLKLIYIYGGMVVPDSFICTSSLKPLYLHGIQNNMPFVCETINRTTNMQNKQRPVFLPGLLIYGAERHNPTISLISEFVHEQNNSSHITNENIFNGNTQHFLKKLIQDGKVNLIDGKKIGIKSKDDKPIFLDDLMEEKFLNLSGSFGIYIPSDELLKRNKHNWLAVLSKEEIYNSNIAISKYLKASIVDVNTIVEQYKPVNVMI